MAILKLNRHTIIYLKGVFNVNKKGNSFYSYYLVIPAVILFTVFFIVPVIQGVYYSFTYWNISEARFAGLTNYINIITDPDLNITIKNTLIFTILTTFFKVFIGMLLAIFLNVESRLSKIMRSIYFMPAVISNVSVALIFSAVLYPTGILNSALGALNLQFLAKDWLTDTGLVIYTVSAIEVWKWSGFTMVILLAGLQAIPNEYYEASIIDGASAFKKFRYITFPLLMPSFNNALILSLVGGIKVFDIVYAMTGGGPGNASEVLNTYVFKAFGYGYYGEACAASVIVGILVVILSLSVYSPLRAKEVEQ